MFTVEFDTTQSVITSIDDNGRADDIEMIVSDSNFIHIRQYIEKSKRFEVVTMTMEQFFELIKSLDCPEGSYHIVNRKVSGV